MQEDKVRVSTLVASRNPGRYGLDEQDGSDLTTGQPLAILLGGRWIAGRVEHATFPDAEGCYALTGMTQARIGYYFVASDGQVCGLCTGMRVRLGEPTGRE